MAKYLKPQTPLQHQSGDYIYPITTADQVITAKGERLNANLISVDLNESVESDTNINLVNNKPKAGFIYPLASDVVPEGFLLCDGAEYLRAEYPELFAAIGTIYGSGNGSTTFNVPNLQNNNMQPYIVNYIIATGKDTGISVADIIAGAQALPLGVEYGGTGATNSIDARKNLGVDSYVVDKVIYGKGKNLLENTAKSQTINGVTFKVNADGSVTANGTATNYIDLYLNNTSVFSGTELFLAPGDYICSKSGPVGEFYCGYGKTVLTSANIADKKFTAPNGIAWCFLRISEGEQLTNHTFYPMIRLASETDDTYEPYYEGLKEVHNKLSMELLWENASPASEFSGRTLDITVPSDAAIGIIAGSYSDNAPSEFKMILRNRKSWIGLSGASINIYRTIEVTSNGIVISDAKYSSVYAGASDNVNNKFLIPYKIYIVRGVNL